MMEFFLIYLFVMSGKIAALFAGLSKILIIPCSILMAITTVIAIFAGIDGQFEEIWTSEVSTFIKRTSKWCIPIGVILFSVSNLIPSEKQLAIIVGSGVTYNVLTSEPAQRIGGKALELLQKKIDKALEEVDNDGNQGQESQKAQEEEKSEDTKLRSQTHAQGQSA